MEREDHIHMLRKAIQENEQSLAKMKTLLSDMEGRRAESHERHRDRNGNGQHAAASSN